MKRLTILESGIIGFFVGVIVATYLLYVGNVGGYIGSTLNFVSLRPVLVSMAVPSSIDLYVGFSFFIVVYAVYGLIIGFIIKKKGKSAFVIIPLILIGVIAVFIEPKNIEVSSPAMPDLVYPNISIARMTASQADQQYFGTEATGDLNGDGKDDIAFIISRPDPAGTMYYLSTALATSTGHTGTNLIYLGNKVDPDAIAITGGIITILYHKGSSNVASTTKKLYAHVVDGTLQEIQIPNTDDLVWGEIGAYGSLQTFRPCEGTDTYMLVTASSTDREMIEGGLGEIASSSDPTAPMLGVLVGALHSISVKNASSTPYAEEFLVDKVITFTPNSSCL